MKKWKREVRRLSQKWMCEKQGRILYITRYLFAFPHIYSFVHIATTSLLFPSLFSISPVSSFVYSSVFFLPVPFIPFLSSLVLYFYIQYNLSSLVLYFYIQYNKTYLQYDNIKFTVYSNMFTI